MHLMLLFADFEMSLALYKPACVSFIRSTHPYATADTLVDGNRDPVITNRSCIYTNHEWQTWWEVDLGRPYRITSVQVTNNEGKYYFENLYDPDEE